METIHVKLPEAPYPIHITTEEAERNGTLSSLISGRPTVVLTTARIARFCLSPLKRGLGKTTIIFLPDGERFKNLQTVAKAYHSLLRLRVDRSSVILLLGGGVIGDLGGFVASTYLRGVPFVQIPTTLVGQVDSSIGGKVGVDLPEGKNLVGLFQQPLAVLSYIPFLKTLPPREILGGLAEVLKYGVLRDPILFQLVRRERISVMKREPTVLFEVVRRSAEIKADVVEEDEKETSGARRILNFGHTFGHAVEQLTRYRRFTHGEAIAIGMVLAGQISHRLGFCPEDEFLSLREAIRETGLPVTPPHFSRQEWTRALKVDKKSLGGMIHFVFLKRIGEVVVKPIQFSDVVKVIGSERSN